MIVLVGEGVFPGWMVAAIVAREMLVSGLRLAAVERGVVIQARDLGKLKTWSQAVAAALGGFAAAGAWGESVAWWALLVAVVLTWVSGLDYARVAPGLLRGRASPALRPPDPEGPVPRLDGLADAGVPPLGLLFARPSRRQAPAASPRAPRGSAPG